MIAALSFLTIDAPHPLLRLALGALALAIGAAAVLQTRRLPPRDGGGFY